MQLHGQKVYIGLLDYEINEIADLRSADKRALFGEIDFATGTIKLEKDMRPDFKAIVLLHEILHGIYENAGQPHDENTINAVAYGFMQLLRQNPRLIVQLIKPQAARASTANE